MKCYTIEIAPSGARLCYEWGFEDPREKRARLTQRISLQGENTAAYRAAVEQAFLPHLEPGMKRVARARRRAYGDSH